MISVQQAENLIIQNTGIFPAIECPLSLAIGHVLREDIHADRDQPPFHRVAMDGIAIKCSAWQNGRATFAITGMQKAGIPPLFLDDEESCFEVMTGAVLPRGCDCVIRYEDIKIKEKVAELCLDLALKPMQNVHQHASDYRKGGLILKSGCRILSPQIAILASVGKSKVLVGKKAKIALISTGDELVEIDEPIAPYQIRKSNVYALEASLHHLGYFQVSKYHVKDHKQELLECLTNALYCADMLILTGGVSMGKFDFIPEVMDLLGVKVLFHKVKQRPGKPFWFGKSKGDQSVFALPGNPVSAIICFHRYIVPQLRRSSGEKRRDQPYAILSEDIRFDKALTYFLPVTLDYGEDGRSAAKPIKIGGSGDYGALGHSDGFVELDAKQDYFPKGQAFPLYRWPIH